jgi:hypothetical protein
MGDTNQKYCSRCNIQKDADKFLKKCNICKECENARKKREYHAEPIESHKTCSICKNIKPVDSFLKNRVVCKECNNEKRRNKYKNNEDHRLKLIKTASEFKHQKVLISRKKKEDEIGKDNKKCSICSEIKSKDMFRHNRLKCRICEREEPLEKMKRYIRTRIYIALKKLKKQNTIQYLGLSSSDYFKWILSYNPLYTIDNYGKVWHIDHVIPLSRFNLNDENEHIIAFNWRNTMPLSAKENLAKNNRILVLQIEQHYNHLINYHKENQLDLPQVFNELFVKHLVDGNTLKLSLPLTNGNICEELG